MSTFPAHDEASLAEVRRVLTQAGAALSIADLRYLRDEVGRIVAAVAEDRVWPEGEDTMFNQDVEDAAGKRRKGTAGGRPPISSLRTAMHALADLYIQMVGRAEAWSLPSSEKSPFPRFAAAALAPLFDDPDGKVVPRLAKLWQREQRKMMPIQ